ncbi:peptidoglycan-binding protein [Streptomyces sp. NPDC002845]
MTDQHDGPETGGAPAGPRSRRVLRVTVIAATGIAAAAVAGAAAAGWGGQGDAAAEAAPTGPPATAKVEKTTFTRSERVRGTLGHGTPTTLEAPGGSGTDGGGAGEGGGEGARGTGTVTWLPKAGDTVKRGKPVYRVDERPVPLLYGSVPLYRTLGSGSEGKDVEQLERNLAELGYGGFTVDEKFTDLTAQALRKWQSDLGLPKTGRLAPGEAAVASGAIRVDELKTAPGRAASGEVLTYTGTKRVISVDLKVAHEGLVKKGTAATVTLPDDSTAEAEVTRVGTAATAPADDGEGGGSGWGGGSDEATIPVELTVADTKQLGSYQSAPVGVVLKAEERKDVLAVPVNALVALLEGGYGVEVVQKNGTTSYLRVKLGMFADGKVEISGDGLKPGLTVGVPK